MGKNIIIISLSVGFSLLVSKEKPTVTPARVDLPPQETRGGFLYPQKLPSILTLETLVTTE